MDSPGVNENNNRKFLFVEIELTMGESNYEEQKKFFKKFKK